MSVPDKASTGTLEILATPISAEIVIDGYLGEFDPTLYGMPGYDDRGNFAYPNGFDPRAGEWFKGYEQERDEWEKQYEAARRRFDAHQRLFAICGHDLTVTVTVTVTVTDAELALRKQIEIWPPGRDKAIIIKLPAGTINGAVLRIPGHGQPLPDASGSGDLLVTVAAGSFDPATMDAAAPAAPWPSRPAGRGGTKTSAKRCTDCGGELHKGNVFCETCGASV